MNFENPKCFSACVFPCVNTRQSMINKINGNVCWKWVTYNSSINGFRYPSGLLNTDDGDFKYNAQNMIVTHKHNTIADCCIQSTILSNFSSCSFCIFCCDLIVITIDNCFNAATKKYNPHVQQPHIVQNRVIRWNVYCLTSM